MQEKRITCMQTKQFSLFTELIDCLNFVSATTSGPKLLCVQGLVHCWESVSDGLWFYEKLPVFYRLSFVLRMEGLVAVTLT